MQQTPINEQLLEGCRRLAAKGLLNTPDDGLSLRIPGQMKMVMCSRNGDWLETEIVDVGTVRFSATDDLSMLHAAIYRQRNDVGAIAISSPKWVRLLAQCGGSLPPIFDEQVRHIGTSGSLKGEQVMYGDMVRAAFRHGANAALLGERLLCLGMTCDRALFNTELYEKCAQAYMIAKASDRRVGRIPFWVRLIANRRLLKDEETASASYRDGRPPEGINAY